MHSRIVFACKSWLAAWLLLMATLAPGSVAAANAPRASATSVSGPDARLNDRPLEAGSTLYPGDVMRLGAGSSAAFEFGGNLILAAPQTDLVLEPSGIRLRAGRIQVRAKNPEGFEISGALFRTRFSTSGETPASAEIRVGASEARIAAVAGLAEVTPSGGSAEYKVHPGEVAVLNPAGAQSSAGPSAGQVSRLLPEVEIVRASGQQRAAVASPVYWNDVISSGSAGRARVTLNDGSMINLGSNSSLRITQHDAAAQQTALELAIGRMRARVVKLTTPGGKFEVRTSVGVAGLVGTDFYLYATPDYTDLIVFEDAVKFTTLSGQSIVATAGMYLRIMKDGTFIGPRPATQQEIQDAIASTDVPEPRAPTFSPVATAAPPAGPILVKVLAGAAVVTITGIEIHRALESPTSPAGNN